MKQKNVCIAISSDRTSLAYAIGCYIRFVVPRSAMLTQSTPPRSLTLDTQDRRGSVIDLKPVAGLLDRIITVWIPNRFGSLVSRARGDAHPLSLSDWDFLAVLPDNSSDEALDPIVGWRIRKDCGVRADILPCCRKDFEQDRMTVNTLAHEAATKGTLIFER